MNIVGTCCKCKHRIKCEEIEQHGDLFICHNCEFVNILYWRAHEKFLAVFQYADILN